MLSIYEAHEEKIKCQLMQPIYDGKIIIDWVASNKFCYCQEKDFQTTQTTEQGRRKKTTKGTLITYSLKNDEINLDWKINYDGNDYLIESMIQEDDHKQQTLSTNCVVKTTLQVRR